MFAFLSFATTARANEVHVVGVVDGDTIRALTPQHELLKIRLSEIDAPEKRQPFGMRAKQELAKMIFDRDIEIRIDGRDRYGRTLAHLELGDVDVNFEMVRRGYAWCYIRYLQRHECLDLQSDAKKNKRGLWADAHPEPPWQWRHPHPRV